MLTTLLLMCSVFLLALQAVECLCLLKCCFHVLHKITQVGTNAQVQPYGPNAGDAALVAARKGPLELREVHFSYPLRQNAPGVRLLQACSLSVHCTGIACLMAWGLQPT